MYSKRIKIALVGNPNSGKSTLFNALTGLNQKVANFPGVTVDKKTGNSVLKQNAEELIEADIIDLPGTYSLYPKSPDERITFQVLADKHHSDYPDLTVVIADGSNLKRSLFLCSQVIDLGIPCVLALNMMDLVESKGLKINIDELQENLGIKVIPVNARKKIGINELKDVLTQTISPSDKAFIHSEEYSSDLVKSIIAISSEINAYGAFQLANNADQFEWTGGLVPIREKILGLISLHRFDSKKFQAQETLDRYNAISKIIKLCVTQHKPVKKLTLTSRIDRFLTHGFYGYLFFLIVMFTMFQAVFAWSSYPMELIEQGFLMLGTYLNTVLPAGILTDLLVNGILAGLSGIAVFVPQIALLFFFIAILEDTGYLARVSFIMDKMMRKFGLNGKSIIPLISGVACAVPAIMSARTIQNWKERIITIMVTPLMSCSARIPVYTLLISLVIPHKTIYGFINLQGLTLMLLYLLGFVTAIGSAWFLKFLVKGRERSYFIMEMPVYRMPRWANIGLTIVEKVKVFLFDAGKVIIAISIVLWVLSSYGPGIHKVDEKYGKMQVLSEPGSVPPNDIAQRIQSEKLEGSYAGMLGRTIEPVIKPLGFDWKIGIALITSFAAREVFVGTMATIYSVGDTDNRETVREKMHSDKDPVSGIPLYTLATGLSLMVFYAFAMQCMSTVAVVYRETKQFKWPFLQVLYLSSLAYLSSLLIYQLLK